MNKFATPIYENRDLVIRLSETPTVRLEIVFDKPEGKGTIILKECGYGLDVLCPDVHPELPVAFLDLFYASPEGREVPGGPPLQIEFYSPAQLDDPLGQVRCFPDGTRVRFEPGVIALRAGKTLSEREFGVEE